MDLAKRGGVGGPQNFAPRRALTEIHPIRVGERTCSLGRCPDDRIVTEEACRYLPLCLPVSAAVSAGICHCFGRYLPVSAAVSVGICPCVCRYLSLCLPLYAAVSAPTAPFR